MKGQIFLITRQDLKEHTLSQHGFSEAEERFVEERSLENKEIFLPYPDKRVVVLKWKEQFPHREEGGEHLEQVRFLGSNCIKLAREYNIDCWEIVEHHWAEDETYAFIEGLFLSSYTFERYKKDRHRDIEISLIMSKLTREELGRIKDLSKEVQFVKDLINEPFSSLNAGQYARSIRDRADATKKIKIKLWTKEEILQAEMGGLLGVNKGSVDAPAFVELEYSPQNARNEAPIVLLGKGVVYDAGGMNIKTEHYMDNMKMDMAGGAIVAGVMNLIAHWELPLKVKAYIPATDNRLNGNALVPGDIIKIGGKTTVEIVNTDAEGRLLLADAACYSQKDRPMLTISIATLTGAAARALGNQGIACMQERLSDEEVALLTQIGYRTHERVCFFPMWKEYEKSLESKVAELKNCGEAAAGMITAAKFIGYFVKSPFLHLDIAGVDFNEEMRGYYTEGASATGLRLLVEFFRELSTRI